MVMVVEVVVQRMEAGMLRIVVALIVIVRKGCWIGVEEGVVVVVEGGFYLGHHGVMKTYWPKEVLVMHQLLLCVYHWVVLMGYLPSFLDLLQEAALK